ncbi:MAG: hypothetical protein ACREBF_01335 [Candidatus Micrarchaeales archaeon]
MAKKKSSSQKRLEMLRKTQELTEIVERGSIEEQALSDSADSQGMAEDQHLTDLLAKEDDEWENTKGKSAKSKPRSKFKAKMAHKKAKSSKAPKKKGRR